MIPFGTPYERARFHNATTYGKWPLDEASAASAAADDSGFGPYNLTGYNSPGLASTLWNSNEVSGQGSRTFSGTSWFQATSSPAAVETAAIGNWTISCWVKPDVTSGIQTFLSVGGTSGGTSDENSLMMVGMNGTALFFSWEYGAGNDVGDLLSTTVSAGEVYFAVFVKDDDPANTGKKRVTSYLYAKSDLDAGILNPSIDVSTNLTNSDGGANAELMIGAQGRLTATNYLDGTLSDIRWDANPLEQQEIEDIIAGYYREWDDAALEDSGDFASYWKVYVKDSDGSYRDLSKMEHINENFLIQFDMSETIDQQVGEFNFSVARGRDNWSVAPLDEDSPLNKDDAFSYTDLLGVMREFWLKTCRCPQGYTPTAVQFQSLFHGFSDDWTGSDSGDSITIPCRDRWAIVMDTQIKPDSATLDQRQYGSSPSGTAAETVMQQIIDDNDRTYTWNLKAKPEVYTPTSPSFGILPYNQLLEPVATALTTIADQIGWMVRYTYFPGMYTWRLTFSEPERDSPTVDHTFRPKDIVALGPVKQSLEEYRNDIEVQYIDAAGTANPDGEKPRASQSSTAGAAELLRYGERYARLAFIGQISTSTEASKMAVACRKDLSIPDLALTAARHFFPFVRLNDYYTFNRCAWWTSATDAAVRSYSHQGNADGTITTVIEAEGKPKSKKAAWHGMIVHPGVVPNNPRSQMATTPNPTCTALPMGVEVAWARITRNNPADANYDHTEVHLSTSGASFTPTSATLKMTTTGNRVTIQNLIPGTTYYSRLVHVDKFGNRGSVSSSCNATPTQLYFWAYTSADQNGLTANTVPNMATEVSDPGNDFDLTNDEWTAPFDCWVSFSAQASLRNSSNEWARLEINRGGGYGTLADGNKVTGTASSMVTSITYVQSGDLIRLRVMHGAGTFDILGGSQDGTYIKGLVIGGQLPT